MKLNDLVRCVFAACVAIVFSLGSNIALADFRTLFPGNFGSKWGDTNHGTPSDTITWSFMDDLTVLAANHPLFNEVAPAIPGTTAHSDITSMRTAFDLANPVSFNQSIQNAFNTWAAASNGRVTFQQVADNGAVAGDSSIPASYAVDIRIGAFHSVPNSGFAGIGAAGFGPPGNDLFFPDALAGDIFLNMDSKFFVAPGNEGDIFHTSGIYINDLEGLVLHELGHAAIGLAHSIDGTFPALGDVMYPFDANFVNRQLSAQDIAGLQSVYGIAAVPEPSSLWLISIVLASFAAIMVRKSSQLDSRAPAL